ncbi:MAG: GWxTD domain-containing protein [Gemmatimonadota bacterium]|nr:GWxTD domain-containing protein [Gemmatimonadota bacterium]
MKIRRGTACLVVGAIAWCNGAFASESDLTTAEDRFRIAVERLGRVTTEESLRALNAVLALDENHVPAHVEIARLHMSKNTPPARSNAEKYLRRAIRLDPENGGNRVLLGDLLWAQGFLSNAKRQYEQVLARDQRNARAAFGLGVYYVKDYMKYWNMIDTEGTDLGVVLEWRHFAREYRELAIRNLGQSIRYDPGFKDAYYQLGLVYMEDMQSAPAAAGRALVGVANSLLKAYPADKDALLFVGLGYHTGGYPEKAWDFYIRALERMDLEERSIIESLETVAGDEERMRVTTADAQAQGGGGAWVDSSERERFWRRQDPLLLTERNERRMEHYRRVAYANLRFGKPRRGIAGWRTEMGRVYIKYGDPLSRKVTRPEVGQRGETVQAHTELWAYEGFSFRFRNWNGLDGWHFDVSSLYFPSGEWVLKRTPQRFVDPYRDLKYSMPYQVAAFRDAGRIRLEVAYAIAKERLRTSGGGAVDLQDGLFLYDGDWNEVSRAVYETRRLADAGEDSVRGRYLLSNSTLMIEPGSYHLVAEVQDRRTRSIGTFRNTFALATEDSTAAMSDLLVATGIESEDPFPERREDLRVVSNPLHTFYRSESVYIYFEAYNLARDDFGRTKYEITYRIGQPEEAEVTPGRFQAVALAEPVGKVHLRIGTVGADGPVEFQVRYIPAERNRVSSMFRKFESESGETAVTVRYEGDREDDFTYLQIELDRVPAGVHALSVELKDLNNAGQGDERRVLFRVME